MYFYTLEKNCIYTQIFSSLTGYEYVFLSIIHNSYRLIYKTNIIYKKVCVDVCMFPCSWFNHGVTIEPIWMYLEIHIVRDLRLFLSGYHASEAAGGSQFISIQNKHSVASHWLNEIRILYKFSEKIHYFLPATFRCNKTDQNSIGQQRQWNKSAAYVGSHARRRHATFIKLFTFLLPAERFITFNYFSLYVPLFVLELALNYFAQRL